VADDDRERAIEAVLAPSRQRPSSPRWLWTMSLVIGVGCAVAFVIALVRGGDAASSTTSPTSGGGSGSGFPTGLALGLGVGIAIGWLAARRGQASAERASHSSRSRP